MAIRDMPRAECESAYDNHKGFCRSRGYCRYCQAFRARLEQLKQEEATRRARLDQAIDQAWSDETKGGV